MFGLPLPGDLALDFEFVSESGALPVPVCMVARELISNRLIRLWQDEFGTQPPFRSATTCCSWPTSRPPNWVVSSQLGWPLPTRVLDLYTEFRNETNGIPLPEGRGMLSALSHHGISAITAHQKTEERALVMGGGPWSTAERRRILDYCQTDVDSLGPLLERMLPGIQARNNGFGQAFLRGRYMAAVARMERTGVPIDSDMLGRLRSHWGSIKLDLIGPSTRITASMRERRSGPDSSPATWPTRGSTGRALLRGGLQLDQDTFRDMAKRYPKLEPLKELRHTLSSCGWRSWRSV